MAFPNFRAPALFSPGFLHLPAALAMSDVAPSKPEYSEEKGVVTQGSESLASSEEPDASFILADKRLMRKVSPLLH